MKKQINLKKATGPVLAIVVFVVVCSFGFILGRYIAHKYYEKYGEKPNIFKVLIVEKENIEIKEILTDGPQTIQELCAKETGVCDKVVGKVRLNNEDIRLHIYVNFDNPEEVASTYFKLGDRKISSFYYIDTFEKFAGKFLIVTEPNSQNANYLIHVYNHSGSKLMSFDATNLDTFYHIDENDLFFYFCDTDDNKTDEETGELLFGFGYFRVNSENPIRKIAESNEYLKCA